MLVTPSHKDADVTAFMTMWNREEFWHGEALATVLTAHGWDVDFDELKAVRLKVGWKDRLDPIKQSLLSNAVGSDFIAVHMAWGAANEWSAIAAYNRLADLESHPVLSELLRRIARQEAKHVAFYASQARDRLAASKKAQVIARFALSRFWGPVGSGIETDDEVVHVLSHLMGNEEGLIEVRKIDTNISKMPGLEGLKIVETALAKRGVPGFTVPAKENSKVKRAA
jgi:rubrerythrin